MEIDEHLKYTLYVLTIGDPLPASGESGIFADIHLACNSTPAQEPENRWFHDVSVSSYPLQSLSLATLRRLSSLYPYTYILTPHA